MVKSATSRSVKYSNKNDADVMRSRITAMKATMDTNVSEGQAQIAAIQQQVRDLLDDTPAIATTFSQPFMACALELYGKSRRFTGQNLQNEGAIVLAKWNSRVTALTGAHDKLVLIAGLFNVTYA